LSQPEGLFQKEVLIISTVITGLVLLVSGLELLSETIRHILLAFKRLLRLGTPNKRAGFGGAPFPIGDVFAGLVPAIQ